MDIPGLISVTENVHLRSGKGTSVLQQVRNAQSQATVRQQTSLQWVIVECQE